MKTLLRGKYLIVVLLLIVALTLSAIIGFIYIPPPKVSAEITNFEERCKQFTDSDYLLNQDGTL